MRIYDDERLVWLPGDDVAANVNHVPSRAELAGYIAFYGQDMCFPCCPPEYDYIWDLRDMVEDGTVRDDELGIVAQAVEVDARTVVSACDVANYGKLKAFVGKLKRARGWRRKAG